MKGKRIIKRIITVVLSVVMILSVLPTSAFAAVSGIAFSLNLVSETNTEVVLSVKLDGASFDEALFSVITNSENIGECKSVKLSNTFINYQKKYNIPYDYQVSNESQYIYIVYSDLHIIYGDVALFTFKKNTPEKITNKSFSLVVVEDNYSYPDVKYNLAKIKSEDYNSGNLRIEIVDGEAVVTDCRVDAEGDIKIPSEFNGCPVTTIGNSAFVNCSRIKQIFVPESVTTVEPLAFYSCSSMEYASFKAGMDVIDYGVFMNCTHLKYIGIPDGTEYIIDYAFANCVYLERSLELADVQYIGNYAFFGCERMGPPFYFTNGAVSIGFQAFTNTLFYNNENNWENNVLYFRTHLLEATPELSGDYTIKNGTTTIANATFYDCTNLTGVTIPDSVVHIDAEAFAGCTKLKKVKLPNTIETIPDWMFEGCESLSDIKLPESVKHIGLGVFDGTAFYNNAGNWDNGVLYNSNCLIEADIELAGKYKAKDGTRVIADGAFLYCEGITDVELPSSVITIGNGAFQDCPGLKNITIDNSVKEIGNYTFYNCNKLKQITIPKSVEYIGENAIGYYGDDSSDFKKTDGLVIICQKDSAAEEYAEKHGFDYQIIGDVSGDKNINSSDALKVLQSSVGSVTLTDSEINLADVNRDKLVNSNDALAILQYTVGIKTEF